MQEIAFQSIRNQKFPERAMPLEPPGGVNPLFKKILDPPLLLVYYLGLFSVCTCSLTDKTFLFRLR